MSSDQAEHAVSVPILQTHDLTRRFGSLVAVDRLNISVAAGELFGLLGANGAGKTVTMKMLTTLLPPSSGNATVAGFDLVHHAGDVRRMIGYVPDRGSRRGGRWSTPRRMPSRPQGSPPRSRPFIAAPFISDTFCARSAKLAWSASSEVS
jgi:predicted ATPase with chaperone activity